MLQLPLFGVQAELNLLAVASDEHTTVVVGDHEIALYRAVDATTLTGLANGLHARSDERLLSFAIPSPMGSGELVGLLSEVLRTRTGPSEKREYQGLAHAYAEIRKFRAVVRPAVEQVFVPGATHIAVVYRRSELEWHLHG